MAGKLQNEDHKSLAELTGAGGSASQLLNDTKIYVTGLSLNKQLSQAIIDGDFAGGGASTDYGMTTINSSAGNKTIASGRTLFYPYLSISSPDVYTVSSGGRLLSVDSITVVSGATLTIDSGGEAVILTQN